MRTATATLLLSALSLFGACTMPAQAEDAYPPPATPTVYVTPAPRHTTSWTMFEDGVVTCETDQKSEQ